MNGDLEMDLRADRTLRDAALALLKADVSHVRAELTDRGVGARIVDRIGEGAVGVFEEAVDVAENHRGVLATLIAAIVLWFARHPIMSLFADDNEQRADAEQEGEDGR